MPGMRRSVCMPLMSPANHKTSSPRKMVSGSTVLVTPFAPPSCMAVRNNPGVLTKSTPRIVLPSKAPPATTRMGIANSLKFKSCDASANKTSMSSPQVNADVFSNPSISLKLMPLISKLLFDCVLLRDFISLPLKSPFEALRNIPPKELLCAVIRLFFVSCCTCSRSNFASSRSLFCSINGESSAACKIRMSLCWKIILPNLFSATLEDVAVLPAL
mmetsp:Transcript_7239/g.21947  ORF Transcript_7239/g.21947 Transcript_7239/m.21947 type:complete len:216 (+) Transcript_7239:1807-2454(+)